MRAAFLSGCMVSLFLFVRRAGELQRPAIPTEPDCYGDEYHGNHQSKPKTGRAQVCGGGELWAIDRVHVKSECIRCESQQTVFQHRSEMRGAERDLLKEGNREKRQDCTKKSCSPRPA